MARTQVDMLPIGVAAGVSFATFTVLCLSHLLANQNQLSAQAQTFAPSIAEDAVKSWITQRFGVTPDMFRRISARADQISSVIPRR